MDDPIRIEVRAGAPTDEEVAALTAVVLGIAAATPAEVPRRRTPAWGRAGRLEGLGLAPLTGPRDARLQTARPLAR